MLNLAFVVIGVIAYKHLGVDLYPKVDIPSVVITTQDPGAGPEEIESDVTSKIEAAVNVVSGVTSIQSQSFEGLSTISVAFDINKNGDVAAQETRDQISSITDLPKSASTPQVEKLDLDAAPILRVTLTSPRSLAGLTGVANEQLKRLLERVDGVGQVRVLGGSERQIRVSLDPDQLRALNFTVPEVAAAIQQQNFSMPGGSIDEGAREITVRTVGAIQQPWQMGSLSIGLRGHRSVRLSEVASIEDTNAELRSASYLNGTPAVSLLIMKQSGRNTIEVIDNVKAELTKIQTALPSDIQLKILGDQSIFIRASIEKLQEHLILGSFFAAVVVYLFLRSWQATVIAAIAIPVSLITSFSLIKVAGYTLNEVTMLALTLMVGIVIDDAIVVLENIYHVMMARKLPPLLAAVEGTKEIGPAVVATTLSLLAVFIPVGFMQGLVGRFLSSFGLTSAFAILVSLFVSFTLTPMMSGRLLKTGTLRISSNKSGPYEKLEAGYLRLLSWSLAHRSTIVVASIALILATIPLGMFVGKDFRPVEDQSRFEVQMLAPEGSTLADTLLNAERVAVTLRGLEGVSGTLTSAGGNNGEPVNRASIYVSMVPISQRHISQMEAMARARTVLKSYPATWNLTVQAAELATGGGTRSSDVEYHLTGPDLDQLNSYAKELAQRLEKFPDAVDVSTSVARPKPELQVKIDRARAADLGVSTNDLAQSLNALIAGQQVTSMNLAGTQVPVWLQVERRYRSSVQGLQELNVASATLGAVNLRSVARLISGTGPAVIERWNRQREVSVFANVKAGSSQSAVNNAFERELRGMNLARDYHYEQGGASKQLASAATDFGLAFALSFIFMYMVLTALLESLVQPIIILLTLPLSVPCGLLGLVMLHQNMNIFSALGILLLFGVVKKNAILQITHSNNLRAEGMPRFEALIQSNKDRLRPILMTTLALVVGMLPLVLATGAGSSTSRSIGVLVAAGQTLCLMLTLLMVPVFYTLFEDITVKLKARWPRSTTATAARIAPMVLIFVLFHVAATAQRVSDTAFDDLPTRLGTANSPAPKLQLTVEQAIELALKHDQDLLIAGLDVQSAEIAIGSARGAFDPLFNLNAFRERRRLPVSSSLAGAPTGKLPESEEMYQPQLSGILPWQGGKYSTSLLSRRLNSQNIFDPLAPQFQTALNFTFTQPLLRNRTIDVARQQLWIAQRRQQMSTAQFKQKLSDIVLQVVNLYWDLYASQKAVETRKLALESAQELTRINQRRVLEQLAAESELVESKANTRQVREAALASLDSLNQVENQLKSLILGTSESPEWSAEIVVISVPAVSGSFPDLKSALEEAQKNRPELEVLEELRKINELTQQYSRDQLKPVFDLSASYTASGLAGHLANRPPNPLFAGLGLSGTAVPPILIGGYSTSLANLAAGDFPALRFSVNISLPLRNRTAEAGEASALIEQKRLRQQLDQLEKLIQQEVRNGEFSLRIAQDRLRTAGDAVQLAEKLLSSERRLYEAGLSSVFLVIQRQNTLIDARLTESEVQSSVSKMAAAYRRATGTLLDYSRINVAGELHK
ncbi:MAG: efflux RND transporter permease subunit [Acidobacteriaceae bacterium]|nr:efflux RND transporter permease subunit [Acidobacteriaceae bacterium]